MDPSLVPHLLEYQRLLDSQRFDAALLDYSVLDRHVQMLELLNVVQSSAIAIFDLHTRSHTYLSSGFESLLGFDRDEARAQGNAYFDDRQHPEDRLSAVQLGSRYFQQMLALPPAQRMEYKLVYEYRLRNGKGEYVRILEQFQGLELCPKGNIWLVLCIQDFSPDQDIEAPFRSRVVHFPTGKTYSIASDSITQPAQNEDKSNLTTREREVLGLVAEGLLSKQIADRLSISINTVNTYRQRIIEKLQTRNLFEAVSYAQQRGMFS